MSKQRQSKGLRDLRHQTQSSIGAKEIVSSLGNLGAVVENWDKFLEVVAWEGAKNLAVDLAVFDCLDIL